MIGIIFVFLIPLILPYFDNATSYPSVRAILSIEQTVGNIIRENIPTTIRGRDITRWIVVVGSFILSGMISRASERFHDRAEYLSYRQSVEEMKSQLDFPANSIALAPLDQKLEQLKTARRKNREQLVREFAATKQKLDRMGRDLAFLAIDVVDSIGMKEGEERAVVEHDFKEYKRFVEGTLIAYGSIKSTWTPDGVMSAFKTVDAAVRAAREVITRLETFNTHLKNMRRDFHVRCGVNSGFVYFDDSLPLEEVNDRVIDIAGHMQKHAKPNTVCVPKPLIEPLNERIGFEPSGRVVDGYEVYEWRKA
jgi:class 3 adenylate cyclase